MKSFATFVVFVALTSTAFGQEVESESIEARRARKPCPLPAGIPEGSQYSLPHSKECDAFYICQNGFILNKYLCPDGLVFIGGRECVFPYGVECGDRDQLQTPKGRDPCPRLNGHYPVEDNCNEFITCKDGVPAKHQCPSFLVFEPSQGVCIRPDNHVTRPRCLAENRYNFVCPINFGHKIFRSPEDCRAFFTCSYPFYIPHLGGCPFGTVFNEDTQRCDEPEHVRGCHDYYDDLNADGAKTFPNKPTPLAHE